MLFQLFSVFGFRLLGSFLAFLSTMLIIRVLGVDESGLYFIAISFVAILTGVCTLGAPEKILHTTSSIYEKEPKEFVCVFINLLIIVSFVSVALSFLIFSFASEIAGLMNKVEVERLLQVCAFILPLLSLSSLLISCLLGLGRSLSGTFFVNVFVPLLVILFVSLSLIIKDSLSSINIIILFGIANGLNITVLIFTVFQLTKSKLLLFNKSNKFRYPKECLDFWLINIVNVGLSSGLILLGVKYCTSGEIALISVSGRLCLILNILISSVNVYSASYFSKYHASGNSDLLMQFAKKVTRILAVLAVCIMMFLFFLGEKLLSLFGNEFIDGYWFLLVLALGPFFSLLVGPCQYLLMMTENQKSIRNSNSINLVLSIPLTLTLSYFFGVEGLVVAISLSSVFQYIVPFFIVKTKLGFYTQSLKLHI